MILSPEHLRELLHIIEAHHLHTIDDNNSNVTQAYKFGVLSEALGDQRAKQMTYPELKRFIQSGQFVPLNSKEQATLRSLKYHAYSDITNLGRRIGTSVEIDSLETAQQRRTKYEEIIQEEAERTVANRESTAQMVSRLGRRTGDWQRDLGRISDFVLHSAFDEGRAAGIERGSGGDARVYKDVYPGACKHCIRLYLSSGVGSKPLIFRLDELRDNGTNVGKKVADWKAVIGPVHPWCRCTLHEVPKGYEWNEETQSFSTRAEFQRRVRRRSRVSVTVGGKETII